MAIKKKPLKQRLSDRIRIRVQKNGPYLVYGGVPLEEQTISCDAEGQAFEWRPGKKYPLRRKYALCRCGQSRTKPFCDGTHVHVHFDGTETADRALYVDRAALISGPDLDLMDVKNLCARAGFCTRFGGIWNLTGQSRDPEVRQTAIEEAENCPTGRLVVMDKTGKAIEPGFEPSIVLVEHSRQGVSGPIWVRGGIPVESADGTVYEIRNRVALCGCGRSSNKPFCDGNHLNAERESEGPTDG